MSTQPYTVLGYWTDDSRPVSVGVIEGEHEVTGGTDLTEGGTWSTVAWSETGPESAEYEAIQHMRSCLADGIWKEEWDENGDA